MRDKPRYGRRKITTMMRDWERLRKAAAASGDLDVQDAFDYCEEWVGYSFGAATTARDAQKGTAQ